jgi:hypothetical protein
MKDGESEKTKSKHVVCWASDLTQEDGTINVMTADRTQGHLCGAAPQGSLSA